ncbi:hypothetical protein [Campylobacter hyointestinalis]|uniref:Uncharacterized protein n=1 Tax=Campylobacter hyointestinalis TaxID=198 RepID=A0A562XI94_CAMHY|nr:hypothetical protein [Campylobacter hyointestinalis]RAZ48864.1 hypothetical protein CHL14416_01090 [Campylobacter hyointestinalis subsp. lawsonii]TWO21817.1 hypothetical protein YZ82_02180 [Campylobacter hyointestinalis]
MFNFITDFFKKQKIKKFLEQNRINFNGYGGFNIDGLVINEFGYLIKYISDGTISNFYDLQKIHQNKDMLLKNIDKECSKETLKEQEHFNISHETAIYNQNNLKNIIIKICSFIDICKELKLDYIKVKNSFYES